MQINIFKHGIFRLYLYKLLKFKILIVLILFSILSCNKYQEKTIKESNFLIETICKSERYIADTTKSFSYYYPQKANENSIIKVVFFMDSRARGYVPVELYKNIANEFGFVLIGSNNIKNGTAKDKLLEHYNLVINELHNFFNLSQYQIYLAGFSGGARMASIIAQEIDSINGVILCGAGLGTNNNFSGKNFVITGLVGDKDFNYFELKHLTSSPLANNYNFIIFDGKHNWPPQENMKQAFYSIKFNLSENNINNIDNKDVNNFIVFQDSLINFYKSRNNFVALNQALLFKIKLLNKITDTKKLQNEYTEFINSIDNQRFIKQSVEIERSEIEKQGIYQNAFIEKNYDWWKTEIEKLNNDLKDTSNLLIFNSLKRQKGFISLLGYMYVEKALQTNQTDYIEKFLKIYELVDSQNPDLHYFKAIFLTQNGKFEDAIISLKKSIDLGLEEPGNKLKDKRLYVLNKIKEFNGLMR